MRLHRHLPLPVVLALRAHLGRHRALSAVTLLAIAASVTLATGLEMSSRSVEAELEQTARSVAGAAQLEVVGGSAGIPESLLDEVSAAKGVRVAVPVVQAAFRIDRPDAQGAAVQVLGVDLLTDPGVRAYSGEAAVEDPLRLLSGRDGVIVSRVLADRLHLAEGDALALRFGTSPVRLTVRGLLAPEGLAAAYGGQIAVMDVYALQALVGRSGWLDRIDVVLAEGAERGAVASAIRDAIGPRATVRPASARDAWLDSALLTVRLVVATLLLVAILVASIVSYSALSLSVDRRIPEIALLRTAGLEPRRVRRFLYVDAALLALVGAGVGALLGRFLSAGLLVALSWIAGFLQGVELHDLEVHASTLATAVLVGGLVAFAGVLEPARRAARHAPLDVLLGGAGNDPRGTTPPRAAILAAFVAVVLGAAIMLPRLPPILRVGLVLVAGLSALGLLARAGLPTLLRAARPTLDRLLPGLGRLAGASLSARPLQTTLAVVCVGGVVAGITLSLCVAESATRTLDGWMSDQFRGGVFVTAGPIAAARPDAVILPESLRAIRETPGVRGVFDHVGEKVLYQGEEVLLAGGSMDVMARFGRLPVLEGDPRAVAEAVAAGGIVVSDRFAWRFGVREGDVLSLDTPKGLRRFPIVGRIRDYAGPAGSLNLDIRVFDDLWPRRGSRDLVFWTEGDPEPVIAEIRRRVPPEQALFFAHGEDLSQFVSRLLRRFQAILASISLLTAALGGITVWNLMLSSVTARTREFALLLATGATPRQIRALTLLDGLLLGVFGGSVGVGLGLLAGYPVVSRVMSDALGWSLDFAIQPLDLAVLSLGLLAASALASVYPARVAARVPMREASGAE
ncbi:MAG TPA: FtsX-like permease family protein [Myxococcota bacterium]|jgi:putative ABC transport system permease protein|nr:FtsX-like permease family protein [Myxococcota bacterium]